MGKVKYTGPDDARILDAKDIAKAVEVEGFRKTTYPKGTPVEMDDAVIEAITAVPEIFGNFEVVTDEAEADSKSTKSKAKVADAGAVTSTSSASTADAPSTRPSGKASTGA